MLGQEEKWLLEEKYRGKRTRKFLVDLKKLQAGMPLAYLIGHQPFLNCYVDLKYKPLIPRPETEFWLNELVRRQGLLTEECRVLDLFAGSGCVGIAVLKNWSNAQVDFGEKNTKFIKQIKRNLKLNGIEKNRYQIFKTDVFSKVPTEKYDFILTNPPYISNTRKNTVQDSVLEHEDHDSVLADDDGLFFIKKIIQEGQKYLKPKGKIYIEFDPWQTKLLEKHLKNNSWQYKFQKDQYQKNRVIILST